MLTFVIDNYVNFAGMCWKIVRIAGDGSIKLILEDKDNTCINSVGNYKIGYGDYGFDSKKKGELFRSSDRNLYSYGKSIL